MTEKRTQTVKLPGFIDDRAMGWYQIRVVVICGLVMFLDGFDTQVIAYVAPFVSKEWTLDNESMGFLFSSSLLGLMIGYLGVAPLADRIGHKPMLVAMVIGASLAVLASAFVVNVNQLMIVRLITGIGLGGVIPSAIALTSEYSPKRFRASAVLGIYVGYSLGFFVAGLVSGWVIPKYGWPTIFLVGGVMTSMLVPIAIFFLPDSVMFQIKNRKNMDKARKTLRRIDPALPEDFSVKMETANGKKNEVSRVPVMDIFVPRLIVGTLLFWAAFAVNLGVFYALQSWLPTIIERQGYAMDMMVMGTMIATLGGIVSAFIVGPSMDRLNPYYVLSVLYLLGFVCLILFGFSFAFLPWVILLSSFFVGFCVSGGQKAVIALSAIFYPPEIRATGVGWALGIGRVGAIAGPLIIGKYVEPSWPPTIIFGYMAVPMLFLSGAIFFLGKTRKRQEIKLLSENAA